MFLPPVWPPPQLIVFCLHCMRCTVLLLHLLHRLVQLSFPLSHPLLLGRYSTMQARPLHRTVAARRPKCAHTNPLGRLVRIQPARVECVAARYELRTRRTSTRCTRSPEAEAPRARMIGIERGLPRRAAQRLTKPAKRCIRTIVRMHLLFLCGVVWTRPVSCSIGYRGTRNTRNSERRCITEN